MELFDLSQISVQDMLLVKAIAECGSISQAAKTIRISQPTASYRLNKLRTIFSDQIFTSVNRKMSPTVRGLRIIETFLMQIDQFAKLSAPEIFDPKTTERSFTIIAKGFQYSALVAMAPKIFFKETRHAKLFIEQDKDDLPIHLRRHDTADFLALPFDSTGAKGIRRFVSPALKVMIYFDGMMRKAPETVEEFAGCRFVMLNSLKTQPSFVDNFLLKNGFPARNIVGYAPTTASIAGFIEGTDLVYAGSSFASAFGGNKLNRAPFPFEIPPIRHELRWSISKETEASHAWLRDLLITSIRSAFKPAFQLDPAEKFVMLSEFERLANDPGPVLPSI